MFRRADLKPIAIRLAGWFLRGKTLLVIDGQGRPLERHEMTGVSLRRDGVPVIEVSQDPKRTANPRPVKRGATFDLADLSFDRTRRQWTVTRR